MLRRPDEAILPPLPPQPADAPWPTDEWPSGAPQAGVDVERLERVLDRAFDEPQPESTMGRSLACVVVQGGRVIAERYAPGLDEGSSLISWSMAKSITHAAVGLLVADGRLTLDAPAPVAEWADDAERSAITLDQLLRMTPGLEFNEDYVGEGATSHCLEMLFGSGRRDMAGYAASQPLVAAPGTHFNYSSGTSNIVSRIVADEVGAGLAYQRWLCDNLFSRIGMRTADARFDQVGTFIGSSYVWATARDFAKFGLLYLRDGVWNGERLLPEGWVDHARTPVGRDPDDRTLYGAHWWIPDGHRGIFAAQGYEGQRILVLPDADAVIVRLGKTEARLAPNLIGWQDELLSCFAAA
ncbi:MAG: serine hydrolase [Acidimicrobiales bacterium]|nr:serine hydrolase [Acidimicrobiales bacterium]